MVWILSLFSEEYYQAVIFQKRILFTTITRFLEAMTNVVQLHCNKEQGAQA